MFCFDTNSLRVKKTHRLMGQLSTFFWWTSILMIMIHLGFCFADRTWTETDLFSKSLVKNETIILVVISGRWIVQAALYFLFGRTIIKNDIKLMVVLAIGAMVLPILRHIILRTKSVNFVWDIACWGIVLYWIGWVKLFHKYGINSLYELFMLLVCSVGVFIRSYYGNAEISNFQDALGIYSFVIQDMLRSFAMIFFGLWLLTYPRED